MSAIPPYVRSVIPVSNELLHTTQCFEVASELIWVLSFFWEMDSSVTRCVEKVIKASRVWRRWGFTLHLEFWRSGQKATRRAKTSSGRAKAVTARRGQKDRSRRLRKRGDGMSQNEGEKRESIPTQRYLRGQRLFGIVG